MIQLAVSFAHEGLTEKANLIAKQLNVSVNQEASYCLWLSDEGLFLKVPGFLPIKPDFNAPALQKRHFEGKKQGLVRACKPSPGLTIIDATAGWGKDAAILASFGANVLMIERNPVMGLLLFEALGVSKGNAQLQLHLGQAYDYLNSLKAEHYPDVIYLDSMHPERSKSAKVKKDMQVLQELIGPDEDVSALIELAITRARKRVVVKWPAKVKPLVPAFATIGGKTVRFDVYAGRALRHRSISI